LKQPTAQRHIHQRYVNTELWQKAQAALGAANGETPDFLNEDNLARFGAYWSDGDTSPAKPVTPSGKTVAAHHRAP
jgi:hypothetical protein